MQKASIAPASAYEYDAITTSGIGENETQSMYGMVLV